MYDPFNTTTTDQETREAAARADLRERTHADAAADASVEGDGSTPALEEPPRPLDGVYNDAGVAHESAIPANCPVLSGGSSDPSVPRLIRFLNDQLGSDLPISDVLDQGVLLAVQNVRARLEIPVEQGLYPPSNFVGPSFWAAVQAYENA